MTRDNVTVSIDSVLVWHVVNPYKVRGFVQPGEQN
jgi:regulator of protease activity HflC (stomatin/prohibitin superfamily)